LIFNVVDVVHKSPSVITMLAFTRLRARAIMYFEHKT
jgi:hypothetical protein